MSLLSLLALAILICTAVSQDAAPTSQFDSSLRAPTTVPQSPPTPPTPVLTPPTPATQPTPPVSQVVIPPVVTPPTQTVTLPPKRNQTQIKCTPRGSRVIMGSNYARRLVQSGVQLVECGSQTGSKNLCDPNGRQVRPNSGYARALQLRGVTLVPCAQAKTAQLQCTPNGRPVRPGSTYARALQARGVVIGPCTGARRPTLPQRTGMCGPNGRPVRPGSSYAARLQQRGVTLVPCGQGASATRPPRVTPTRPQLGNQGMCDPNGRPVRPGSSYATRLQQRGVTLVPCPARGQGAAPTRPQTLPAVLPVRPQLGNQGMCDPNGRPVRPGSSYAARLQQRGVTLVPCPARGQGAAAQPIRTTLPGRPTVLPAVGSQAMCDPSGRPVRPGSSYAARLQQRGVTLVPCPARGGAALRTAGRAVADSSSTYESANTQTTPAYAVALIVLAVVVIVVLAIVVVKLVMFLKRD